MLILKLGIIILLNSRLKKNSREIKRSLLVSFSKGKTNTYILQMGKRLRCNFSLIIVKSFFLRSYVMIQGTDEAISISLKFYFRATLQLQNLLKK